MKVPLAFILMSHKRKRDYSAVFVHILSLITEPENNYPKVKEIVSDFEKAVWVSLRNLLPQVEIKGCSFHLNQAMYRHIKKIGLGPQYRKNQQTRTLCRELLSLNLLPAEKIEKRFNAIVDEVSNMRENALLKNFCNYIERTWITSTVWPLQSW